MNSTLRTEEIEKAKPSGEIKSIRYKGKSTQFAVKELPLSALIYNPYNGRIRSLVKSFESSQNRKINPENNEDVLLIEQYLYDSAKGKNEKTLESLREIGQQEVGIVTKDGVIIDGNRRAMLLNIINKSDETQNYFKAIVLPDNLKDNEKEITLLETRYQMGVDSKVEYNPIEKYIRCDELNNDHGFSIEEIAEIMAESTTKINEWLKTLELMEAYLIYLESPKIYTRLEKREGHFVDLHNYLKIYYSESKSPNWNYSIRDIEDLQKVYFDYIRLGIPVQRARVLAKPTAANSFFCREEIWTDFITEHIEIKRGFDEKKFSDIKAAESSNVSNEDIVRDLDGLWRKNLEAKLIDNLSYNESNLKDIIESYNPLRLLKKARHTINQIKTHNVDYNTRSEVVKIIEEISEKLVEIKYNID